MISNSNADSERPCQ